MYHWLIAAGGLILEVPPGGTSDLTEIPSVNDCRVVTVTKHEKDCVKSYGAWLQNNWVKDYNFLTHNCHHFVWDVLAACLFSTPKLF